MIDPRYAAAEVTAADVTAPPERHDGATVVDPDDATAERDNVTAGRDGAPGAHDPQATTELPRTNWDLPTGVRSQSRADTEPKPDTGPSWSAEQTQDFPAYRPQSYPTYPPVHAPTAELPVVPASAGGAPTTTPAGYGTPSLAAAAVGPRETAVQPARPRRRDGAGWAGALGLIGLAAAAFGAFALPLQKLGPGRSPYFATLRELSTHQRSATRANAHSVSLVGGHGATLWWRYGLMGALGVLALLFLVLICVPVLRRVAGLLLFLGALATIAGSAFAVHQTNDYRSVVGGIQGTHRVAIGQLGLGIWVALAGCAVVALSGLIATAQSTRR